MKPKDIGAIVRARRIELKLSTTGLAKKVKISQAQISRLENGKQGFRSSTLAKIADALGFERQELNFPPASDDNIVEQQVWDALETIYDPEIPVNLVDLGLIYQVEIDQASNCVAIDMTLTAPGCGMGPVLVGDVEYRVGKVPNVASVQVELVFDPPWSRERMSEEAQLETGMFY